MEKKYKVKMTKEFGSLLANKKIGVSGIPDKYDYMESRLVELLKQVVPRFLKL